MLSIRKNSPAYLIHMLAKQDTPINASRTVFGFVPAKLNKRVMITRSIFVLLRAEAIVKPPINSMIVGENICEKMNLNEKEGCVRTSESLSISQQLTSLLLVPLAGLPYRALIQRHGKQQVEGERVSKSRIKE